MPEKESYELLGERSKSYEKSLSKRGRVQYRRDLQTHKKICSLHGEMVLSKRLTNLLGTWGNTLRHLIGQKIDAEVVQRAYRKTRIFERVAEKKYE